MIRAPWVLICQEAQSSGSASYRSFLHRRGSTSWDPGILQRWASSRCCSLESREALLHRRAGSLCVSMLEVMQCQERLLAISWFVTLELYMSSPILLLWSRTQAAICRHAESCAPNPPAHLDPQHRLLETGMVRTGAHVRERLHLFYMPPRSQHLSGRVMHAYILGKHEDARSLVLSQKSVAARCCRNMRPSPHVRSSASRFPFCQLP